MEHDPVELRASPGTLEALGREIERYRVEHLSGGRGDVSAIWFQADQLYLVTVDILGLAFKFEVFTLALQTPAAVLTAVEAGMPAMEKTWADMREAGIPVPPIEPAPTGELEEWPFRSWRLEVLKRMEFIVGPEHLPERAEEVQEYFKGLHPGQAPRGSEHTCLAAMGLLFTEDDGRRLLVVADGMPGSMRVTDEEDAVQSYLQQCIAVPVAEYIAVLGS